MPFSEKIKLKVKRMAAFNCCRCKAIGLDVHHIVPEKERGPNTIENAAPLCQNCHDSFGDNPTKRKEITQMRDFWYDVVKENYFGDKNKFKKIDEILTEIRNMKSSQAEEIKKLRNDLSEEIKKTFIDEKKQIVNGPISNLQSSTSGFISTVKLADNVHANFQCRKCRTVIGLLVGSNKCPNCGEEIK